MPTKTKDAQRRIRAPKALESPKSDNSTARGPTYPAEIPPHRILREVLRHYNEFKALVSQDGRSHVIPHGYYVQNADGSKKKISITISFWDLQEGLKELAPRKREAIFWNVIMDQKQKDVAKRMGITTVSVGQYVEAGCIQLAKRYFAEELGES